VRRVNLKNSSNVRRNVVTREHGFICRAIDNTHKRIHIIRVRGGVYKSIQLGYEMCECIKNEWSGILYSTGREAVK